MWRRAHKRHFTRHSRLAAAAIAAAAAAAAALQPVYIMEQELSNHFNWYAYTSISVYSIIGLHNDTDTPRLSV